MNGNQISYPPKGRGSYLWLAVGTLVYWLAPIFYIRFIRSQKTRRGFFLVWLAIFVTVISPLYPILNAMMPSPLPVFLIMTAITALTMGGIPYFVDRLLAPHNKTGRLLRCRI